MGKTVVITGVNSYFAQSLLPILQEDSEVERIIGIDVSPWRGGYDKVEFIRKDIRDRSINDLFVDVDTVYHLAFIVGEIKDKNKTQDINIQGSINIFRACVKNKVQKVIYTSSNTVYGCHPETPIHLTEEHPLHINKESYYNKNKVEVEDFVTDFFSDYPDIILTVIRAALLFGPNTRNMFAKLYEPKFTAMPLGQPAHIQLIHEEDLGEALYLAFSKDIPGIYNVGADDAVSTQWTFHQAGQKIVHLPLFLLKPASNLLFKLGLAPASAGWVVMASNTIFSSSAKFKKATGWVPKYSSEEAFQCFVDARQKVKEDSLTKSLVATIIHNRPLLVSAYNLFKGGYKATKFPVLRNMNPWSRAEKNSFTYLPINENLKSDNEVLLPQVVHDFIDKAKYIIVLNTCGCRTVKNCQHHTNEIGCMFMGESTMDFPKGIHRKVTREEAHAHVERAISVGLVPMTGKVRVDNDIFMIPDKQKLLSVCFCCHCCCMMTFYKDLPASLLDQVMPRAEGLEVTVTSNCIGCGTCVEYCGFDAISIKNGKAVHSDKCRGCGRCERYCPNHAVQITSKNPVAVQEIEERICQYVDIG